ncbi:MAG: prephenate dehydrogenase, partial [Ilumatobacter sp.]
MTSSPVQRRANVIGLGLIGGSIALALKSAGWKVSGDDTRQPTLATALER